MSEENTNIVINGAKVMWAKLAEPSEMSGKYQVDLVELDAATVKTLTKAGITVKDGKDKKRPQPEIGKYVVASATRPVPVVDGKRNAMHDVSGVGNGTIANVIVKPYEWNFKGKSGIGCGLQAVQIDKLKEYSGATDMFGDVKGGYEAPKQEAVAAKGGDMFGEDDAPF
jgi:hypothetical protein